jgi:hypothetical protein
MNSERERIWKEIVVACFKVLSLHLPWTEEKPEYSRYPAPIFEPGTPEYE